MRKYLLLIIPISFVVLATSAFLAPRPYNQKVDDYYVEQLQLLNQKLGQLELSVKNKSAPAQLQDQFKEARKIYKKAAIFIEYFNPYEAKFLNGPVLKRVEEDNPTVIIEPQGFQVVEEKLFGKWDNQNFSSLETDLRNMQLTVKKLINESDRAFKFRDEAVWDALRAASLRMMTMGITGFDSPVATNSLPESLATLEGIKSIINIYKSGLATEHEELETTLNRVQQARLFIVGSNAEFDQFDRLHFISSFANPLYGSLVRTRVKLGFVMPNEKRPVNPEALSIFDNNAFDIRFFSPADRYQSTPQRIELGRKLFYDPILSGSHNRSCGTCHQPQKAFTDGLPTALSIDNNTKLSRNTPTLWNAAFQTRQFYDSRTTTLEDQLSAVVHNANEMQGSLDANIPLLQQNTTYATLFKEAYPEHKDPIIQYNIANAIASYIRSLVSLNSRFDQYMRGENAALSVNEKKGFNLFMGKGKCGTCHFMPLFNGLVPTDFTETESEVLGVPRSNKKRKAQLDPDLGKYNFTTASVHKFSFKTPTIRNVGLTAPYMHNGVFKTLEEVLDFYNKGGGAGLKIAPETQTLPANKLNLTKQEKKEIILFMGALTDTSAQH